MRKFCTILITLILVATFVSIGYTEETVRAANDRFKEARKAYILAKREFGDAQIDALFTIGKAEKREAVERVRNARKELRAAKNVYKDTIHKLHQAEMARDAKRDRSPWR